MQNLHTRLTGENSAKFTFYYLLSLVALIFVAQSTGMIIFQIINKYIPDILNEYSGRYQDGAMKFAISSLFVAAPIFYFFTSLINKNLFSGEIKKESQIRKWLSYLILLISSLVIIGWLIGVLNNFLDGELTLKFTLKALTVFSIATTIFTYYFYDIRRNIVVNQVDKVVSIYFYVSLFFVLLVFVVSLFIVESPIEARNRKIDERIISTFYRIESEINRYYKEKDSLPMNFEVLKNEYPSLTDGMFNNPITKEIVEYSVIDETRFELCADFRTSNLDIEDEYKNAWSHDAGKQCLKKKVFESNNKINDVPVDYIR